MKKILALTICLILTFPLIIGTAYAADETGGTPKTPAIECTKIGVPGETDGFHVILEEPLGGPDAIYCFRVCQAEVKEKRVCKYKPTCAGDDDFKDKSGKQSYTCQRVQVLKADSGVNLLNQYVGLIYLWAAGTIGIVAVLTMVISGVQIMVAGGDSAKNRIVQSLVGLVILFLSGLILYTINPTFFV